MDLKLKNKVVVITGGATGIGRAAAEDKNLEVHFTHGTYCRC